MELRQLLAVAFKFDYSLDKNNFFNTQAKKDALEAAGRFVADNLSDTLAAISPSRSNKWRANINDPATGNKIDLASSLKVGADEILVFAGGRNLPSGTLAKGGAGGHTSSGSSTWIKTVKTRGETGVTATRPTDTAPWGGSITFDSSGVDWHFGKTTAGLSSSESDFMSVAVHELGHVLGINNSTTNAWSAMISGSNFIGPKSKSVNNGRAIPVDPGKAHFADGVKNDGIGVAMDPSTFGGERKMYSRLDFAAFDDIGWEINTSDDSIYRAKHLLTHIEVSGIGTSDSVVAFKSISDSKDVDFYRIYVTQGARISVSVSKGSSTAGTVDTVLRLYDQAGGVLKEANQGGKGGTDSLSKIVAPREDYYYIAVSSFRNRSYNPFSANSGPGGTTGGYTLGVTLDDSASSLNRQSSAKSLGISAAVIVNAEEVNIPATIQNDANMSAGLVAGPGTNDIGALSSSRLPPLVRTSTRTVSGVVQHTMSVLGSPLYDTDEFPNSRLDDVFSELLNSLLSGEST